MIYYPVPSRVLTQAGSINYIYTYICEFIIVMKLPRYHLRAERELTIFEFVSEGPKGSIPKLIEFTETNLSDFYNLAFGDKDKVTGKINDKIISNNNDAEKVLATVVSAIYAFTDKYPDAWVYATGSTDARTRLYRMGITKYYEEVKADFYVFGQLEEGWAEFELNKEYEGFAVKRKMTNFAA
jgi:hypothetical protein